MSDSSQVCINEKDNDLEIFKERGWDRDDLDFFYVTVAYIKSKLRGCEHSLFLMPIDFIDFCLALKEKGHNNSFHTCLLKFVQLYLDSPYWAWYERTAERGAMLDWRKKYSRSKFGEANPLDSFPADRQIPKAEIAIAPERKHVLLLAIEISRLQPQMLENIQSGSLTIGNNDLQNFYRLPWIWHYGPGELQNMKATLANELAEPEQNADSLIIGTMLKPVPGIRITPEIKGSEMRAVFEKLDGKTFNLLCDFRMADLGKSSVKFYRMP